MPQRLQRLHPRAVVCVEQAAHKCNEILYLVLQILTLLDAWLLRHGQQRLTQKE